MVEKPKYPRDKLNEEDEEILDKVVLNYAAKFYALTEKYSSPKRYAKESLLKVLNKDSNIAVIFTLAYLKNSPDGQQIRPEELNEKLANDIRNSFEEQYLGLAGQLESNEFIRKFLSPYDLRVGVLKKLEDQGVYIHLTTKEEIISHQDKHPFSSRRSSSKGHHERGGRLSIYILADEVERLKKVMEKPGAVDYLYKKIVSSGLAPKLFKFQMLAFLYAAKMDKRVLDTAMSAGAIFSDESQNRIDTAKLFQQLQQIDDNKLEQLAESQINSLIEDRGYYSTLFLGGLFKL